MTDLLIRIGLGILAVVALAGLVSLAWPTRWRKGGEG